MTNTMNIRIFDLTGPNCVTLQDGQAVFEKIYPELSAGRPVALDFAGTRVAASPFFNAAIGQLLKDIPTEKLNLLLTVQNLSPAGLDTLKKVIENSREYYRSERARNAVNQTLENEDQ